MRFSIGGPKSSWKYAGIILNTRQVEVVLIEGF